MNQYRTKSSGLILIVFLIAKACAFLPILPPPRVPRLKNIIFTRAAYSSFIERFSFSSIDETILTQITTGFDVHTFHPVYFFTALSMVYVFRPDNTKLKNLDEFNYAEKMSRQVVFIFFMLFLKYVESAT